VNVRSVAKLTRPDNVQAAVSSAAANLGKMAVAVGSSLLLAGVRSDVCSRSQGNQARFVDACLATYYLAKS
jgi:hypothetical protein